MPSITATGLGSGLDIEGLVSQLVQAEAQPAIRRLDLREAEAQAQLTAYGTLRGAFDAFQTSLAALQNPYSFLNKSVRSSDGEVASASATNSLSVPCSLSVSTMY